MASTLCLLTSCAHYRDFTLPPQPGNTTPLKLEWHPQSDPVLKQGPPGAWDATDVLNPSVVRTGATLQNAYSGFDGHVWRTGLATSVDGLVWSKHGQVLGANARYIAANGSALISNGTVLYYFQEGRPPHISLARNWHPDDRPVLETGPRGSWDERGVADPYVLRSGGKFYLYYLGMDRARRQRLGVAESSDGTIWYKLRSNPILELGGFSAFDENGLGEPAVFAARGFYLMLYTGRDQNEMRRIGTARSRDGVHWEKLPYIFAGDQPWNSKVLCDPSVLVENGTVRVWFGGGDVARPDENIHGQIGVAELRITPAGTP